MKTLTYLLIFAALLCSCHSIKEENPVNSVMSLGLYICILDETFNDRLNPESSSYFGDEFIKNTNCFFADDSENKHLLPSGKSFCISEIIKSTNMDAQQNTSIN